VPLPSCSITLDLPVPPSVNRVRRLDLAGNRKRKEFYSAADVHLLVHGPKPFPVRLIHGAFELRIQIPDHSRLDLDNHIKSLIDYLVSREFIPDDSPQYLRRLVLEWGFGEHCRITINSTGGLPCTTESIRGGRRSGSRS
jgi:hypothetical protein